MQKKIEQNPETEENDEMRQALGKTTYAYRTFRDGSIGRGIVWTKDETDSLIRAIRQHGRDWPSVVPLIPTRNRAQICAMAQLFQKRFEKNSDLPGSDILPAL